VAELQAWEKKLIQLIHNQHNAKQITARDTKTLKTPTFYYTCILGFLQENPNLLLHMQGVHFRCPLSEAFSLLPVNSK